MPHENSEDAALHDILNELGIPPSLAAARGLQPFRQAALPDLVVVAIDFEGKPFILTKSAAAAWRSLANAAIADGVTLQPFSGFRSYLYQKALIKRHLEAGRPLDEILQNLAIPGYSEHHTGRAVDITCADIPPLTEEFEQTAAFRWLQARAGDFRFTLSFPRNNALGFIYEPWHWCYQEASHP